MPTFEFCQMTPALGLRQFVELGGNDVADNTVIHQPGPRPGVCIESRVPAVHQQQRSPSSRREIVPGQAIERVAGGIASSRVAVSRQVHQVER